MEIDVIESKDNPLLSRKEVKFQVKHMKEATPSGYVASLSELEANIMLAEKGSDALIL